VWVATVSSNKLISALINFAQWVEAASTYAQTMYNLFTSPKYFGTPKKNATKFREVSFCTGLKFVDVQRCFCWPDMANTSWEAGGNVRNNHCIDINGPSH